MLKYNTLYQSLKKVSGEWHAGNINWFYTWNYFKFFEDGIFISSSIAGNETAVINLSFVRGALNTTHGKYELGNKNNIKLFFGNIEVEGQVNNDCSIIIEGKIAWDILHPID